MPYRTCIFENRSYYTNIYIIWSLNHVALFPLSLIDIAHSLPSSAGLRTGQTGQLPRGLHKKGPPQKHIFFNMAVSYSIGPYVIGAYLSTFASFILIMRFILKSMDKICHAQNSNHSVKHH